MKLAFERGMQTCPMFNNLTSLLLGDWCMGADFYPLLRILQGSSKLKELNVKLKMACPFLLDMTIICICLPREVLLHYVKIGISFNEEGKEKYLYAWTNPLSIMLP
jgi:hypothetical protein